MDLFRLYAHAKPGAAAVTRSDSDSCRGAEDDAPFFDLDFADDARRRENDSHRQYSDVEEFDFEMSPSCGGGSLRRDASLPLAPSDGLFDSAVSEKSAPGFLVKSAARIRSFHLSLRRKPKSSASADPDPAPAVSLFAGDRTSGSGRSTRLYAADWLPATDVPKLPGDVLRKYLDKIRPLYVRISKRYGERLHLSGPLASGGARKVRPATEGDGDGQLTKEKASAAAAATRMVSRRLRKSRSASAAAKRDDTLLEQQDGIQSAIAHCKRTLNRSGT